jgi:hypothetical protein
MKILAANNYPLVAASARWSAGTYPGHHLWGIDALARAGHDVDVLPHDRGARLSRLARGRLGDLGAEVSVLRRASDHDVAYAADPTSLAGIGAARRFGVWRRPVVCVIHPRRPTGVGRAAAVSGYDVAICISRVVRDELVAGGRAAARTPLVHWGPDLDFAGYRPSGQDVIVSTGRTARDLETLVAAAAQVDAPFRVHVTEPWTGPSTPNVSFAVAAPYDVALADLCAAAVVAIPLRDPERSGSAGLTELNDALALAKPVVMTANRFLDVDCSIDVPVADVAAWVSTLRSLWRDASARADRGATGRAFAEASWNARDFGAGLVAAVELAKG